MNNLTQSRRCNYISFSSSFNVFYPWQTSTVARERQFSSCPMKVSFSIPAAWSWLPADLGAGRILPTDQHCAASPTHHLPRVDNGDI